MPQSTRPMSDQTNIRTDKENNPHPETGTQRQQPPRQRQPTQKVAKKRAEEAATVERREAAKARKAERARRAKGNSDESDPQQSDENEAVASTTFKTRTVPSKTVSNKTKALAKRNPPAWVKAARRPDDASEDDGEAVAPSKIKTRTVPSETVSNKTKALTKRDQHPAREHAAHTRKDTMNDDGDNDDQDEDDQDENKPDEEDEDNGPDEDDEEHGLANREHSPELDQTLSAADVISLKRRPSESSFDSLKETKVPRTSGGRPKAADYSDSMKALIVSAIGYYRANLSSACAFPDVGTEAEMLSEVWKFTCGQVETKVAITPQIAKIITSRGSQLRGELKSKTRPLVEGFFGFESGLNRKIIAKNRETAENLKDGKGFIYKIPSADEKERKGMYQAKIIQKVVNVMWFRNKQDEGIRHEDNFNPLSNEALALVLAAIECCIDEWISGIRSDIPFSTALYKDVYEDHIRCLDRFNKITKKLILPNILLKLYNRGRFHAGAVPISSASKPTISDSAFHAALEEYEEDDKTESDGENGDSDDN